MVFSSSDSIVKLDSFYLVGDLSRLKVGKESISFKLRVWNLDFDFAIVEYSFFNFFCLNKSFFWLFLDLRTKKPLLLLVFPILLILNTFKQVAFLRWVLRVRLLRKLLFLNLGITLELVLVKFFLDLHNVLFDHYLQFWKRPVVDIESVLFLLLHEERKVIFIVSLLAYFLFQVTLLFQALLLLIGKLNHFLIINDYFTNFFLRKSFCWNNCFQSRFQFEQRRRTKTCFRLLFWNGWVQKRNILLSYKGRTFSLELAWRRSLCRWIVARKVRSFLYGRWIQ